MMPWESWNARDAAWLRRRAGGIAAGVTKSFCQEAAIGPRPLSWGLGVGWLTEGCTHAEADESERREEAHEADQHPLILPRHRAIERARSRRSRLRGFVMCFVIRSVTLWSPSCWRLSFRAHLGVGSMGVPPGELASKRQGAAGQPQRPGFTSLGFRAQPFLSHPPPLRRDRGHKRDVAARNDSANH